MKKIIFIVITICLTAMCNNLVAQPRQNGHRPHPRPNATKVTTVHKNNRGPVRVNEYKRFPRNKVIVVRERNMRSMPALPPGYLSLKFRERNYFYHGGIYYDFVGNNYSVIAPPIGIRIRELPVGYTRIVFSGIPYFYFMGAYYRGVENEYEVMEPKMGMIVPELPQDNVQQVTIDGINYYEYDNILYKEVVTDNGVRYKVVGKLSE